MAEAINPARNLRDVLSPPREQRGGRSSAGSKMEQDNMTKRSRRRMLIKAVHDAAIELATRADGRYAPALMPDEPVIMVARIESAAEGRYLDNKSPTPDEIDAFTGDYIDPDVTNPDELWAAFAINTVNGTRHPGVGRTAAEAKTCAWLYSHCPVGTTSALVKVSTKVPDGWTFELYPPPKPKPEMLAISALAIFELVRLTIPNVTPDEVQDTIMQSLPYVGGQRQ
jgi:hypothetical protein